jgi:hypothetical protein
VSAIQPKAAIRVETVGATATDLYRPLDAEGIEMKSLKCDLCEHIAEEETFEDWMMAPRPHYMEAHSGVMNDSSRGKEEMEAWMKENRERSDAA